LLGQALLRQGHVEEAGDELRSARRLMPQNAPERDICDQLLKQCDERPELEKRLAAVLAGEPRPDDPSESLVLARVAADEGRSLDAAHLFEQAFTRSQALADDIDHDHRYAAACSAVRAAAEEIDLDEGERTRLRDEAAGWLAADLEARTKALDADATRRPGRLQWLEYWRENPDLASVRDPDALAELPDDERPRWEAFWRRLDDALRVGRTGK
jgi:hypothetical protein